MELVFGALPVTGATSLTCTIQRVSDSKYYNSVGPTWQVGTVTNALAEVSGMSGMYELAVNASVQTDYAAGTAGYRIIIEDNVNAVYETVFVAQETNAWFEDVVATSYGNNNFGEGIIVRPAGFPVGGFATGAITADAIATDAFGSLELADTAAAEIADKILDEPMAGHVAAGTLGDYMMRMLGLRQQNNRVKYTAWNAGGVPTAGVVYIYATKADMDSDTGATGAASTGSYTIAAAFDGSLRPTSYTSGKLT
jgi:hypothetical protein